MGTSEKEGAEEAAKKEDDFSCKENYPYCTCRYKYW